MRVINIRVNCVTTGMLKSRPQPPCARRYLRYEKNSTITVPLWRVQICLPRAKQYYIVAIISRPFLLRGDIARAGSTSFCDNEHCFFTVFYRFTVFRMWKISHHEITYTNLIQFGEQKSENKNLDSSMNVARMENIMNEFIVVVISTINSVNEIFRVNNANLLKIVYLYWDWRLSK